MQHDHNIQSEQFGEKRTVRFSSHVLNDASHLVHCILFIVSLRMTAVSLDLRSCLLIESNEWTDVQLQVSRRHNRTYN